MKDPNITMEEYIRLEEEEARRHGKVYNWETATYGRIWNDDDVYDLRSIETEFPTIVFNDKLTSEVALSYEPTISPFNNNKTDFRISFDESDNEDYTVIFDKNSFSYKIIFVGDLKTDSKNDNDKVNMPSFSSPEPTVSYFNDLDYLKDFEKEFAAIVYNDALTSKLDFLTEPSVSPQHIDEFNLKDETLLSEYDKEEQNIVYFNDLFPFNVIYPDDSKSNKDNDDKKIDIEQPSGDISVIPSPNEINTDVGAYAQGSNKLLKTSHDTLNIHLPPRDQRHPYLRFKGLECTDADIVDFEDRLITCSIAGRSQAPEKVTVTDFFYLRGMDVASGPERQPDAAAGAPEVVEGAPDVAEGAQVVPPLIQAPQPPPAAGPTRSLPQRVARLEEEVHGMRGSIGEQREVFLYSDLAEKEIDNVLIMEYLVKISKKARILELKRKHLKITVLTSYMSYLSRKIRHIRACTSQETMKIQIIIKQRVKVNQKAHILELKRRNHKDYCSDNPYAVSIKEDTVYMCPELHSASMKRRSICRIQMKPYAIFKSKSWNILEYNNYGARAKKPQYAILNSFNKAYRLN
ncbi:hypothetical protein Tco_0458854 [Tanacetum coccineum]